MGRELEEREDVHYLISKELDQPGIGLTGDRVGKTGRALQVLKCPSFLQQPLKIEGKEYFLTRPYP